MSFSGSASGSGSGSGFDGRDGQPLTSVELRLFLEELCTDLCRFRHVAETGRVPEDFAVEREVPLGSERYADLLVEGPNVPPYLVEIKYGMATADVLARLAVKYGPQMFSEDGPVARARRLVVVVDGEGRGEPHLRDKIQRVVSPQLVVELWDEPTLLAQIHQYFHISRSTISEQSLLDIREAVARVKGYHAFAEGPFEEFSIDALKEQLLWRFSYWRLRQIREAEGLLARQIVQPGHYREVAVVIADLCSFSSFVRDSPDDRVVRESLTSFFSKARYEVVNRGGMLENFVGDQILALFGVPDRRSGYIEDAFATAKALQSVGTAVSENWQRQIDRVQPSTGMHIGVAFGDIQIMPLRPSSRTHTTAIADVINVAARLMNAAGSGEIVVSNSFYLHLEPTSRGGFKAMEPQEARNVGRIKSWRYSHSH